MLWSYVQLDDALSLLTQRQEMTVPFAQPSSVRLTLALTMRNASCLRLIGSMSKVFLLTIWIF